MQTWTDLPNATRAEAQLQEIIEHAQAEMPHLAQVARAGFAATSISEFVGVLASVYRIALEEGHPFIPDLADGVLRWIEGHDATDQHALAG